MVTFTGYFRKKQKKEKTSRIIQMSEMTYLHHGTVPALEGNNADFYNKMRLFDKSSFPTIWSH